MSQDHGDRRSSRRRLLKSALAGGGAVLTAKSLPGQWTRPVVDAVALPAHAATSPMYMASAGAAATNIGQRGSDNRFVRVLNKLVPAARACASCQAYVCVEPSEDGATADVRVYEWYQAAEPCPEGTASSRVLHTAKDVPVDGEDYPLSEEGEQCMTMEEVGVGDLLDRLGVVESAHAGSPSTVALDSVENGARGRVNVTGDDFLFDVPPGTCSPPECCDPEEIMEN